MWVTEHSALLFLPWHFESAEIARRLIDRRQGDLIDVCLNSEWKVISWDGNIGCFRILLLDITMCTPHFSACPLCSFYCRLRYDG
jgi:hypothetical protein